MSTPRRLLARLRELTASGDASLPSLVRLVAGELATDVCSIYVMLPGDLLELTATEGLKPESVGKTRLRVGEGIVGLVAATGQLLNLPDARAHPGFARRDETGEDRFNSLLAVPVRRAGHTHGVLTVQNRAARRYDTDEVESLETVAMLLAEMLAAAGTSDGAEEGLMATVSRRFAGSALVPGIAVGLVVIHGGAAGPPRRVLADDPDAESLRFRAALETMRESIDTLISDRLPDGDEPREILEAYRLVAADEGWARRVDEGIRGGLSAEAAVHRVGGNLRDRMRRIVDPYLRERLADLEDLGRRLLATLAGDTGPVADAAGAVLLARRLGPAELIEWHARGVVGIVIEEATAAGHAAIVARALGIPTLAGARGLLETAVSGDEVVLDADEGLVVLRPELEIRTAYAAALETRSERQAGWAALRERPSETRDGVPLRLMLNVGLALELSQLDATGAAGIGLFRTEIAMLARGAVLDVPEQAEVYARVLDAAAGRQVVFRTLDLGGDKLLPGSPPAEEENPAMGWRSLRIGLDRPALLRRQLRALLLAARGGPLTVMFPMVATVAEFRSARALLLAEAARVQPAPERLEIGTMLEVPALLFQLDELLRVASFVSVGTNDLMQFLFAADRGTPALAGRYDLLSPPVLTLLDTLQRTASAAGVPVSVCGEAASRPLEAMVLAALGITTLSMPASALLPIKSFFADLDLGAFRAMLAQARRNAGPAASLREPITLWARDHGLSA